MVEVLAGRVLLTPADRVVTTAFYRDTLGLAIHREFSGGTVFFIGGGFLEVSGEAANPAPGGMRLWLQVRDLAAAHKELADRGVPILREPRREPWGLDEMWIADPDGVKIVLVEVPPEHPMRRDVRWT